MRKALPISSVVPGHPDYQLLQELAAELDRRAGGKDVLAQEIPKLLRECIDDVIQTPRTGRRSYDELEKTEKTYIGTRVEIMLRALLSLPRGRLDTVILGYDTDIKHTMGNNWMIPTEAVGSPCLLVAADEERALCYLGLVVAKEEYLTSGANRDAKKNVSSSGFSNILWIFKELPYPPNFWRSVSARSVEQIFAGKTGNARIMTLFREIRDVPVSRDVVEGVAQQKDYMRRIRADNGKGVRDQLAGENILLLSGAYDGKLISELRLSSCSGSEFISHFLEGEEEHELARAAGFHV